MAMLNIEYRHSANVGKAADVRRSTDMMIRYLEDIVKEMRGAMISAEYIDSVSLDGKNVLLINGTDVHDVLKGLQIVMPEDEDHCDIDGPPKFVIMGRPVLEWNKEHVEDIPDILMKNAISKVYADMRADRD